MEKLTKAQRRAARKAQASSAAPSSTPAAQAPAEASKPAVKTVVSGVLKVKMEGVALRGARDAWYQVLKAHDGKPAQEYLEVTGKNHPSLPKSGRAENPSGWLRWFVRNGIATIVQPQA